MECSQADLELRLLVKSNCCFTLTVTAFTYLPHATDKGYQIQFCMRIYFIAKAFDLQLLRKLKSEVGNKKLNKFIYSANYIVKQY